MAFKACPGALEIAQSFSTPGGLAYNIYHVAHLDSTSWSVTQINAMLAVFQAWETSNGRARRVNTVQCQGYRGRDLSSHFGSEAVTTGNGVGQLAGFGLPDNCTIAIKKGTGLAGRGMRGRVYWVGLSASQQANDTYNSTEVTAIVTALEALRSAVEAVANCGMAIVHSQLNGTPLDPRTWTQVLSHVAVDSTIDSQRRRLLAHNVHR